MKKYLFFTSITLLIFQSLSAQINPVQNLTWEHFYDEVHYDNIFSLQWEEPAIPHDELIGYNIYRDNELYQFQTEITIGCAPQFGHTENCAFIDYNNGEGFTGYVTAVYAGDIESDFLSFEVGGVLLNTLDLDKNEINLYPNPTTDIIKFNQSLKEIVVFDFKGNQVIVVHNSVKELNVLQLPSGFYLLKAKTVSGNSFEKKFIKK